MKGENIKTYSVIEKLIQNSHRQNPQNRKESFFSKPQQIRDSFQLSANGEQFSKDALLALIDKSVNTTASELSFYFANYNNSEAILDAINFGSQVTCGYHPNFKESGVMSIQNKLGRQIIPIYAVPKINKSLLKTIRAENNNLVLESGKYYSYKAKNGNCYGWTVNEGRIGWAQSESLLSEPTSQMGTNYKWEMRKISNVLSSLAQGKGGGSASYKELKDALNSVGIKEGPFKIDAGAGSHNYILQKDGSILTVDDSIIN